jgi:hypothetical protein
MLVGDADAGVTDGEAQRDPPRVAGNDRGREAHRAVLRELDRVVEQVGEGAAEPVWLPGHPIRDFRL